MTQSLTLDEALERAGFGRFQKKLMVICGLGWAADAMEVLLISFALPAIAQEWKLSAAQKGLLGTAIFLGMLAGVYLSYWLDSAPAPTVILVLTGMFILAFLRRVHLTRRATG